MTTMTTEKQKRRERAMELAIFGDGGELATDDLMVRARTIESYLADEECLGWSLDELKALRADCPGVEASEAVRAYVGESGKVWEAPNSATCYSNPIRVNGDASTYQGGKASTVETADPRNIQPPTFGIIHDAPAFVTRDDLHTALDTVTADLTRQLGEMEDRMIAMLGGEVDAVGEGEDTDEDDCDCVICQVEAYMKAQAEKAQKWAREDAATFGLGVGTISLADFLKGESEAKADADDKLLTVEELRRQVIQHIGNGNTDQVSDMLSSVIDLVFGANAAARSSD